MCDFQQKHLKFISIHFFSQNRTHARMPSDTKEFHELTKKDALCQMQRELDKLVETAPNDKKEALSAEMRSCASLFGRFLQETGPSVFWDKIEKLPEGAVMNYANLQSPSGNDEIRSMLNKLVVVKLNGGLGTSMGCSGPKSVIPVRNDLTFLDLTVQQIEVRKQKNSILFSMFFSFLEFSSKCFNNSRHFIKISRV